MDWFEAIILGAVQGLTEFLPISSDGHLAIVIQAFDRLQGRTGSGEENLFFVVMLHLGTLAAILIYNRSAIRRGASGLLGSDEISSPFQRSDVVRAGFLAVVATLPAIPVGLFFKEFLEEAFKSATASVLGFLVTATVLAITTRLRGGNKSLEQTSWLDALLVGIAQAFAPLPGVSRSGLTIAAALGLGFSRTWAVGFSLLMAVPAILGAAVLELKDLDPKTLNPEDVARTVTATVVAGIIGYGAIAWLVRVVRSGRLWYFSVYLVVLATAILLGMAATGGQGDAPRSDSLDGPLRRGSARPGPAGAADRPVGPLDRPVETGPGPGDPGARAPAPGGD
jgi:undecaprenyl-diphosphatase